MEDLLQVGSIIKPHGVHGEVKVYPTTDDLNRFKKLKEVILDTGKEKIDLHINSVKIQNGVVILGFKEFDNPEVMEKYRKCPLLITRDNAVPLNKDEYFIADLIDIKVITDEGKELGTLTDVIETGSNDVYVVSDGKSEVLIPAIHDCIVSVSTEDSLMTVHLLPGLVED